MTPASDPNYPSPQAIWLREKIPAPLLVISVVTLPIISYVFFGSIYVARYEGAAFTGFVGGGLWFFIYMVNKGAKIAWDYDRIYMGFSRWSFKRRFPWIRKTPWISLAYDEIVQMNDISLNDPAARSFLLPFQLLRLTASSSDEFDKCDIWCYGDSALN